MTCIILSKMTVSFFTDPSPDWLSGEGQRVKVLYGEEKLPIKSTLLSIEQISHAKNPLGDKLIIELEFETGKLLGGEKFDYYRDKVILDNIASNRAISKIYRNCDDENEIIIHITLH